MPDKCERYIGRCCNDQSGDQCEGECGPLVSGSCAGQCGAGGCKRPEGHGNPKTNRSATSITSRKKRSLKNEDQPTKRKRTSDTPTEPPRKRKAKRKSVIEEPDTDEQEQDQEQEQEQDSDDEASELKKLYSLQEASDAFRTTQRRQTVSDCFRFEVDPLCPINSNSMVYEDHSCNLCFCEIIHDLNNYYSMQVLLDTSDQFFVWVRSGRLGVSSKTELVGPTTRDAALHEFKSRFMEKTQNNWCNRARFTPVTCRYQLVEHADEQDMQLLKHIKSEEPDDDEFQELDCAGQRLVCFFESNDLVKKIAENTEIGPCHQPMGRPSRSQMSRALEALIDLKQAIERSKSWHVLTDLTSRFYSLIPHDFGDETPPTICDKCSLVDESNNLMAIYLSPF